MTTPTPTPAPKYAVKLFFKNGQDVIVNVPDPYAFIGQLIAQLGAIQGSGPTYFGDASLPLLILLNEIQFAVSVAPKEEKA